MADLALNDSLINEYINYKLQGSYNSTTIRKLFKYIQPFTIRDDNIWMSDPAIALQLESDPLIEVIDACSDIDLVQNTLLKFMITDSHSTVSYKTLNLNNSFEKLKPKYGATYPNATDKNKAQEHIKALLSDALYIKIIDSYITKDDYQWEENKTIIANIIPRRSIKLTIENGSQYKNRSGTTVTSEPKISNGKKTELEEICSDWNIIPKQLNTDQIHDRYIETNKLKILLSSGLFNLSSNSRKDFTYVVEIT